MWFLVITIVCHVWHAYRLHASHLLFWAQSCMQFAVLTYIGRLACYRFPFIASISEETCSFRQWLEIWHTNVGWTNCLNEKLLKFLTRFCSMEFDCSKEQSKLHNCVDVQFNLKHKIMCCEKQFYMKQPVEPMLGKKKKDLDVTRWNKGSERCPGFDFPATAGLFPYFSLHNI